MAETDEKPVESLPDPMPGTPVPPLTPFNAWSWTTPVIPQFYYNVYSAEQRIRQICVEIGRIQAYLSDVVPYANRAHALLDQRINELSERLDAEVARLEQLIADEAAAREEADDALGGRIDQEITDRTEADDALGARIDAEEEAREAADEALSGRIDAEETARTEADEALSARIDAEETARAEADTALGDRIDAEETARREADDTLQANIDAEAAAREAADNMLDAADQRIQDSLDTEIANRRNADTALGERIDTEQQARIDADTNLQANIDAEAATRAQQDTALGDRIDAEAAARQQADSDLGERIDNETSARESADDDLRGLIYQRPDAAHIVAGDGIEISYDMSDTDPDGTMVTVTSTAGVDFEELRQRIITEEDTRQAADEALSARISDEMTNRDDADDELWAAVHAIQASDETTAETITNLTERIETEENTRESEDTALGERIDAEAAARKSADDALGERITMLENADSTVHTGWTLTGDGSEDSPLQVAYTENTQSSFDMVELTNADAIGDTPARLGIKFNPANNLLAATDNNELYINQEGLEDFIIENTPSHANLQYTLSAEEPLQVTSVAQGSSSRTQTVSIDTSRVDTLEEQVEELQTTMGEKVSTDLTADGGNDAITGIIHLDATITVTPSDSITVPAGGMTLIDSDDVDVSTSMPDSLAARNVFVNVLFERFNASAAVPAVTGLAAVSYGSVAENFGSSISSANKFNFDLLVFNPTASDVVIDAAVYADAELICFLGAQH